MGVNSQILDEANRVFRAEFLSALGQAARWSLSGPTAIARVITLTRGNELKPKFVSRDAGVHEWIDERIKARLRHYDFSIAMKKWANGLQIPVDELDDDADNLMLYADEIASLADDFVEHKHQQVIDLIANGFDGTLGVCYDGQFLYDNDHQDHPAGPVQTNVSTAVLDADGWGACKTAMRRIKKPNGLHANIRPNLVVVPSALEAAATELFMLPTLSAGGANPNYNQATVEVDPRLDDYSDTAWYAFDTTKPVRAVAHGDRKKVGFRAKVDPEGEKMFDEDVAEWGADGRYNSGYYFWQTTWGSDGSA